MSKDFREIYFDKQLKLEGYYFEGVSQSFPNHFHDYYVIGFVEKGKRNLTCNTLEYEVNPGDFLLFNPFDSHGCTQVEALDLTYRAINISIERMREIITTITGKEELVKFTKPILKLPKIDELFLILHQLILENKDGLNREELLYFFIDALIAHAADIKIEEIAFSEASKENLLLAKSYLEKNFASTVSLEELSRRCHLNKYTLIRYFTKYFGVAPYQYLQTIRIKEAKELLSNDKELLSISLKVGFSDQSHFTRVFKSLIGITPKQYQGIFKQ